MCFTISKIHARGFITIELLIAFMVGTLFLGAALMVTYGSGGVSEQHVLDTGPASVLDTTLDRYALSTSSNMLDALLLGESDAWKAQLIPKNEELYTFTPHREYYSPCSAAFFVDTSWQIGERTRAMSLTGVRAHMSRANKMGRGKCDPLPPSSWRNPTDANWKTSDSAILGIQTAFDYAIISGKPYLFVTTSYPSQINDLWVVDVSDPKTPSVVSSVETGDAVHVKGLLDIVVVAHEDEAYAYVLQNSVIDQLQVIDVSDPLSIPPPILTLSLSDYGVNPSGSNPEGRVIAYYDERLFIGLRTTIGPEFLIFDITDPRMPLFDGAVPASFDHSIYDIAVLDDYAYLAIKPGSPPSGLPTRELMVIDVRTNPRDTGGGFNATSTTNDTEGGTSLFIQGNRLYLGRERVSNAAERDFYVFDISSSTQPVYIASKRLGISTVSTMGTPRVTDIVVQGPLTFLTTTDQTRSLLLYDTSDEEVDVLPVEGACRESLPLTRPTKLAYHNDSLFILHGLTPSVTTIHNDESVCPL